LATYIDTSRVPREFVWRRLHSLMGLWFLIFLAEHLFTNSQVALFFGSDAPWFVHSVNFLHNLPYLSVIECVLLGVPILYHAVWGIAYMFSSKPNSVGMGGNNPKLKYARNHAYTWQRASSWIILVGIILHVVQMRILDYPYKFCFGQKTQYYLPLKVDAGIYPVADRLDVKLYDAHEIDREKEQFAVLEHRIAIVHDRLLEMKQETALENPGYSSEIDSIYQTLQGYEQQKEHIRGLESRKIKSGYVMAVCKDFGSLELLGVREAFQSILMCILYTVFVLASVFHGFNGLWTFLITWGLILSKKSQSAMSHFCTGLMFFVGFLGLMAIWGTYFLNLGT
jgi:succinate dehydrogenase / fumarate reductase cytochrome b subunit